MSSTITDQLATTIEEPLARLIAFEPTTFPVLSVYLNTQSDRHGRRPDAAPYLHREFKVFARSWAPSFVTVSTATWSESFHMPLKKSMPRPMGSSFSRVGARKNSSS
jgi:hypothetical protein